MAAPIIPAHVPAELAAAISANPRALQMFEWAAAAGINPKFKHIDGIWRVWTLKCVKCAKRRPSDYGLTIRNNTTRKETVVQFLCTKCAKNHGGLGGDVPTADN